MTAPQGGIPLTTEQAAAAATLNSAVSPFVAAYLETTGRKDIISDEFRKRLGFSLSGALVMAIDRLVDGDIEGLSMVDMQDMDASLADLIANNRELNPDQPDPEPWTHTYNGPIPAGVPFDRPTIRLDTGFDDDPNCDCLYDPRVPPKKGDPDPTFIPHNAGDCPAQTETELGVPYRCTWPASMPHALHIAGNSLTISAVWS